VVNRAHRRTMSAAPQEVSQSRRNYKVRFCSGIVRGEPCQIHLQPHIASMSAIIAALVSELERPRSGQASQFLHTLFYMVVR
jgi:hypothetical protein